MANVLIRNLDEQTVELLKAHAARNGRSLQAELQVIVERAVTVDVVQRRALAARIRRTLSDRRHGESSALIADDRLR